jgi:succinate-semialdehyde dehydrogenase/glutarate-semialdehyde dehydrogenase
MKSLKEQIIMIWVYAATFVLILWKKAHRSSELMETGTVAVNTPMVAIAEAPFGGIKQTGYGREGGSMAIKDYLNVKYTHLGIKG